MNAVAKYHLIMIVDDNYIDRYVAESCLKKLQVCEQVVSLESGQEALQYLQSHESSPESVPDIILLDIRMPGMDGFEFLDAFSKLPASIREHCEIVMLSSTIDPYDLDRIRQHEIVKRFLSKPFSKDAALSL
ncbi:CheY-like chemotaxis protein [Thermoflavifilum aggregans]|uniref:CheY-like chemotaxis protein n=1 Tax=Thermoflavifilum aggregans TaxID=454188 RepID=A0A2M9CVI2_9BACT|nr:response regulator [Thermoflavifilum aggregans]PJJ75895.1 CheY-like chemotaxis protein [Thermoflavifilum aggregans]